VSALLRFVSHRNGKPRTWRGGPYPLYFLVKI
jgi:hypothetical protein